MDITHPDKILFPKDHITKEDLLKYYLKVSKWMIPLIKDRNITQHRFPRGIHEEGFIQKNLSGKIPSEVKTRIVSRRNGSSLRMLLCNTRASLEFAVNQGCITFHAALNKKSSYPDKIVFDLDPSTKDFHKVREAAFHLKIILETKLQLKSFPMLTGSKGVHVVIPIKTTKSFEEVREFAKTIACYLVKEDPKKYTVEIRKNKRGKKIFIDYLRNSEGQTSVAPYSIRALAGAPIAMPISWKELADPDITSQSFHLKEILSSSYRRANPWKGFCKNPHSLALAIRKIKTLL